MVDLRDEVGRQRRAVEGPRRNPGPPMNLLELEDVVIGYRRDRPLSPPIRLSMQAGDTVAILGPNGAGKSTLLKTILGTVPPLAGALAYPGGRRPRVGYVPQGHRLDLAYPLDALQVVLMGRAGRVGLGRSYRAADREAARRQLESVGLGAVALQSFRSLSGGQRQRVLLARALVGEPEVLVLDEPTSELDPAAEHALLSLVSDLVMARGVAVLFVTHEISAAAGFSRTVLLLDGARTWMEVGPTDEYISSERMSRLYGRPVEVRREHGRTLVWLSAHEAGTPAGDSP
jgi:manganese/iron transport system ATP-binding protein